ncbi:MAG TPA: xanthine dehydrogenase family protein molybdopterin-binding subunit [Rugosimonospora sp.]|nr:xanthine dehydrogenase family protein molybdopterin-binding subunit [Rugosimonospora sp.]
MSDVNKNDAKNFAVVNHSVPRTDGVAKVTGSATYASDITLERMAWAKLLRSPFAHAKILSVDVSEAKRQPGVIDVLTANDLGALHPYYGHAVKDHPLLAIGKVRFVGEPVAAVIGEDELSAQEALDKIKVEYAELTPVLDVPSALAPGAVLVHGMDYIGGAFRGFDDFNNFPGGTKNICQAVHVEWGDVDSTFASAAHIVEGEYYFPMIYAYAMEPYVALADYDPKGQLTVHSSAQHPFMVRHDLAEVFDLPLNSVRVIVPYVGGGYGSKSYTKIEPLTAACSWKVSRPVKLQLSVEEAFLTTRSDDARVYIRTAADGDGKLIAKQATIHLNTGAYAENSPMVCRKAANRIVGPYRFPNVRIDCLAIYTNTVPASSYRGLGAAQITFPVESQMDELAHQIGCDPQEFRLRNLAHSGESIHPGLRPIDADVLGDIRIAAETLRSNGPLAPKHGRSVCCSASDAGAHPVTLAMVQVHADGSVSVFSGSTEIGQGSHTVLAQIAAEEMGVPLEKVRLVGSDTAVTLFERSTGASRTTTLMGRAVMEACREAIAQCKSMAAELLGVPVSQFTEERGGIRHGKDWLTWPEIIERYFQMEGCSIIGRAYLRRAGALKSVPVFWEIGVVGLEIALDEDTGKISLDTLVTVGDVGLAIHPAMTESQDLGAATMGLGAGLFEELIFEGQQLMNGTLLEYRVPRFSDLARRVELKLVENRDGVGPYGAKGGGEGSLNPIGACLANALYQAAGVRIRSLPLTPERVWKALQEKKAQAPAMRRKSSVATPVAKKDRAPKTRSHKARAPKTKV